MKARMIYQGDQVQLLLCTGKIKNISLPEARSFLLNYDDTTNYTGSGKWDYEIKMEEYSGKTVAIVDANGSLCIKDPAAFRSIMDGAAVEYITVAEYAALHGKQVAIVRRMCQNDRIEGVMQKGKTWLIPKDSPYPNDNRTKK